MRGIGLAPLALVLALATGPASAESPAAGGADPHLRLEWDAASRTEVLRRLDAGGSAHG